jgi:hypothetical protein
MFSNGVASNLLLQLTVRVTFDRGDVDHFIAEAVRLNDSGSAKYQTIVAGESLECKHTLAVGSNLTAISGPLMRAAAAD